jgi:hypothetical protein
MSGITVTSVTTVDLSLEERLIGVGVLFTRVEPGSQTGTATAVF